MDKGRKASLFLGDVIGVAFGWRYATLQFFGEVPPLLPEYHMLSQGGVCGRVISAPDRFSAPTILEPIGYLADEDGSVLNLRRFAITPRQDTSRVPTILVIGSSMNCGKTTMAANLIHGLTVSGFTIHAGKLTGTACVKDLNQMLDAGANRVLDFTRAGFASTAQADEDELHHLCDAVISHLSADAPHYVVLEIADGLVQRETRMLLNYLTKESLVDYVCLAVHDVIAAPACLEILHNQWGIKVAAVSGAATASPLSTDELRTLIDTPCLRAEDLCDPSVAQLFAEAPHRDAR
jgi:hypothetical protein